MTRDRPVFYVFFSRFLYTTGTLLVAFSSAGKYTLNSILYHANTVEIITKPLSFSQTVYSLLLFPALSCIAVGGILLLITNMQVHIHTQDDVQPFFRYEV